LNDINQKARRGIKLLFGRQILLQIFTFAGGVVLARILTPAQFGLYAIATFLVALLAMIGDFGLAPSFIQRKEELTERDLCIGFTLQLILTTCIVVVLLISAPILAHFYPMAPPETIWLIRALALSLYLTSWRSMSALQLERHLEYNRLAVIEVVEVVAFQGTAVLLALMGLGVWSLVWATLFRGVIGTSLVYMAAPWAIKLAYDKTIAREILRFGIPFQLQNIFNSASYWVTPTLVATFIGPQAVGYLTWASSNGKKPLMLVDNVMRVSFPHLSRIQDDMAEVERILLRYLTFLLLASGVWFAVLCVAGHPLVYLIYSSKWTPAVPALVLYALCLQGDVVSFTVTVGLNAVGKVASVARIYAIRAIANIALSIPLIFLMGFIAVPLVYAIVIAVTNLWLTSCLGIRATFRMISGLAWIIVPTAGSIIAGSLVLRLFSSPALQAVSSAIISFLVYALIAILIGPEWTRETIKSKVRRQLAGSSGKAAAALE